ncbi:MAG: M90 family metallopeptidase [Pseudomonadota bacterium]
MLFLLGLALVVVVLVCLYWSRSRKRTVLLSSGLSGQQKAILDRYVPILQRLPAGLRGALEGKINLFLNQVDFVGCNGLEVTEEMRLSISAQACLLIVNTDNWYDNLNTILIYPAAFKSRQRRHDGFVVTEKEIVRTGESWARGPVVLSWAHSKQGALNDRDGHNVVFHEFAHQLDDLTGSTNGIPVLRDAQSVKEWQTVFLKAYETHVQAVEHGRKTVIDAYGAEGHEEFFAVSVEVFFEKPAALQRSSPEVYEQLAQFFRLNPVTWSQATPPPGRL